MRGLLARFLLKALLIAVPILPIALGSYVPAAIVTKVPPFIRSAHLKDDQVRALLSLALLAGVFVFEAINKNEWQRAAASVLRAYLAKIEADFGKGNRPKLGTDLRLNLLYLLPGSRFLPMRSFKWAANRGFGDPDEDRQMWIMAFQGVCGRVARLGKAITILYLTNHLDRLG